MLLICRSTDNRYWILDMVSLTEPRDSVSSGKKTAYPVRENIKRETMALKSKNVKTNNLFNNATLSSVGLLDIGYVVPYIGLKLDCGILDILSWGQES